MKLSCLQENLHKGVSSVSRSVASRPQLPVLGNILISTDNGRLRLSATNLETGMNQWIGAKVEKEGSFTVPSRVFLEFVSSLPKEKVELSLLENQLFVKSGGYEATFNGIPASEFPPLPAFPEKPQVLFDPLLFSSAISRVSFSAATDEGRPILTGVLLKFSGKELTFVATDGYRLSMVKIENPNFLADKDKKENKETKIILPARSLFEVTRVIEESFSQDKEKKPGKAQTEKEDLAFALLSSGNQAMFSYSSCQIITQLIGGEFPAYEKIIPSSSSCSITIPTEDLLKSVKMASIFARDSANIIRFKIEKDKMIVSANTPQVGTNKSEIDIKGEGDGEEIAFNSRYLLDFLNVVGSGEIIFETSGALSPGVFKPASDNSYLHIIMPVRVQT